MTSTSIILLPNAQAGCTMHVMDNPRDDTPDMDFRPNGAFTISAVRSDPETQGMEVPFATVHVQLIAKFREDEDLTRSTNTKR